MARAFARRDEADLAMEEGLCDVEKRALLLGLPHGEIDRLRRLFYIADDDRSGAIDRGELRSLLSAQLRTEVREDEVVALMSELPEMYRDQAGAVTMEGFMELMVPFLAELHAADREDEEQEQRVTKNRRGARARMDAAMRAPGRRLQPDAPLRGAVDVVKLLCACYFGITVLLADVGKLTPTDENGLTAVEAVLTAFLFLDILLVMNTAINPPGSGKWVSDMVTLFRHYASSGRLYVDVLAALPLDLVTRRGRAAGAAPTLADPDVSLVLAHLRLLLLARVWMPGGVFQMSERGTMSNMYVMWRFRFVPMLLWFTRVLMGIHILTCAWIATFSPLGRYEYVEALYYVLYTLTTVGYGDVDVSGRSRQLFACLLLVIGVTAQGVLMGTLTALVMQGDLSGDRNDKMVRTAMVLRHFCIPQKLQEEILGYQHHQLLHNIGASYEDALSQLPEAMQEQVGLFIRMRFIEQVPMFGQSDGATRVALAQALKNDVVPPESYLIVAGEEGDEMFFLCHGFCDVESAEGEVVATITKGGFFGDVALLVETKRIASIRSITFCDLFILRKQDFYMILDEFPTFAVTIQEEIARRRGAGGEAEAPPQPTMAPAPPCVMVQRPSCVPRSRGGSRSVPGVTVSTDDPAGPDAAAEANLSSSGGVLHIALEACDFNKQAEGSLGRSAQSGDRDARLGHSAHSGTSEKDQRKARGVAWGTDAGNTGSQKKLALRSRASLPIGLGGHGLGQRVASMMDGPDDGARRDLVSVYQSKTKTSQSFRKLAKAVARDVGAAPVQRAIDAAHAESDDDTDDEEGSLNQSRHSQGSQHSVHSVGGAQKKRGRNLSLHSVDDDEVDGSSRRHQAAGARSGMNRDASRMQGMDRDASRMPGLPGPSSQMSSQMSAQSGTSETSGDGDAKGGIMGSVLGFNPRRSERGQIRGLGSRMDSSSFGSKSGSVMVHPTKLGLRSRGTYQGQPQQQRGWDTQRHKRMHVDTQQQGGRLAHGASTLSPKHGGILSPVTSPVASPGEDQLLLPNGPPALEGVQFAPVTAVNLPPAARTPSPGQDTGPPPPPPPPHGHHDFAGHRRHSVDDDDDDDSKVMMRYSSIIQLMAGDGDKHKEGAVAAFHKIGKQLQQLEKKTGEIASGMAWQREQTLKNKQRTEEILRMKQRTEELLKKQDEKLDTMMKFIQGGDFAELVTKPLRGHISNQQPLTPTAPGAGQQHFTDHPSNSPANRPRGDTLAASTRQRGDTIARCRIGVPLTPADGRSEHSAPFSPRSSHKDGDNDSSPSTTASPRAADLLRHNTAEAPTLNALGGRHGTDSTGIASRPPLPRSPTNQQLQAHDSGQLGASAMTAGTSMSQLLDAATQRKADANAVSLARRGRSPSNAQRHDPFRGVARLASFAD